jgi:propanediol dehydratase small subunit
LAETKYPLIEQSPDGLYAASGRALTGVTLEAVAAGMLSPDDLQINAATLRAQAEVARNAGFAQLAENLTRAAELTAVPNDELLRMYAILRPGRSTHVELLALAMQLETTYLASRTAVWVREAAEVYQQRGLLRRDP